MSKLFIPILLGTARTGRESIKAARYLFGQLSSYKSQEVETEQIDVKDFPSPITVASWEPNEISKKWADIVTRMDGLIIVVPEYNHGFPGELKIMLDSVYKEYAHKPVIVCGVSKGGFGGVRAVDSLNHVLSSLGMCVLARSGENVFFSKIEELFDADGAITDLSYNGRVETMFDELMWYARKLKGES